MKSHSVTLYFKKTTTKKIRSRNTQEMTTTVREHVKIDTMVREKGERKKKTSRKQTLNRFQASGRILITVRDRRNSAAFKRTHYLRVSRISVSSRYWVQLADLSFITSSDGIRQTKYKQRRASYFTGSQDSRSKPRCIDWAMEDSIRSTYLTTRGA